MGVQSEHRFEFANAKRETLDYLLYLPPEYDKSKQYPLILFLHGAGERGNNLDLVKSQGLAKRLETGNNIPFIVISPQCPVDEMWSYHNETLMALVDSVIADYSVNENRVYLTGLSMGGYGSWDLARLYPERFTAIVPICGGLYWWFDLEHAVECLKDKPIWTFHGKVDSVVPVTESERVVDALRAVGSDVKFTIYPDLDHDSWTVTYNNPDLYTWFLEQ